MAEPRYDEFGVPLTQSGVSEEIWALRKADPEAFIKRVRAHFALGYHGFSVVTATVNDREKIIWLRDDRRQKFSGHSNS